MHIFVDIQGLLICCSFLLAAAPLYSTNPFVLAVCASVRLAFLGMCRDTHIQHPSFVVACDASWIFHCRRCRDRSKRYDCFIAATTIAVAGIATAATALAVPVTCRLVVLSGRVGFGLH